MIQTAYQAKYIAHELTKRYTTDHVEKNASFDQLQAELRTQIAEAMTNARQSLLENFDDEEKKSRRRNGARCLKPKMKSTLSAMRSLPTPKSAWRRPIL